MTASTPRIRSRVGTGRSRGTPVFFHRQFLSGTKLQDFKPRWARQVRRNCKKKIFFAGAPAGCPGKRFLPEDRRPDAVAAHPSLHLDAGLAQHLGHRRNVAPVLAQEGNQLFAAPQFLQQRGRRISFPQLFAHPLDGFGFVVPRSERKALLAGTFSSVKYPGRAPAGHALIRCFLGGALNAEILREDDAGLVARARRELGEALGVTAEPVLVRASRWPASMPQYRVGHLARIEACNPTLNAVWFLDVDAARGFIETSCATLRELGEAAELARSEAVLRRVSLQADGINGANGARG